jgi:arylsulfatase A-like enzyme
MLAVSAQCVPRGGTTKQPAPAEPVPEVVRPRLVVLLVVDQLPSWSFDAQRTALDGGIARLLERGVYWPHARYPYAGTHTAPGHATIGTGALPAVHGIVANRWIDPTSGELREVDDDATFLVLDPRGGPPHAPGVSNRRLEVDGLAEALHAGHGEGARAIAIGLKGRAAGHVLGKHPDLALWFDNGSGALTSSTAFVEALPPWVVEFAGAHPRDALLAQPWPAEDPERLAALAGGPDDRPGEGDPYGLGATYPHELASATNPAKAFAFTPMASTLLVDAAIAAIDGEQLGGDEVPDLLAVTFSAHDYAGHAWCQESWERVDHLLRLDRDIGRLLDTLDRVVGRERYAVVLTSDHGSTPSLALAGPEAKLVLAEDVGKAAAAAAQRVLGPGRWIAGTTVLGVTASPELEAIDGERRERAITAMVAAIAALPGIGFVERTDRLAGRCDERSGVEALACRSVFAGRSGMIYTAAAPGSLLNDDASECTAHGSPNAYDREVPLVVVAPGSAPAEVSEEVSMLRAAPTIAALLGVPPPAAASAPGLLR